MITLLTPVDRGRKAYRLHCRFTVNAFPDPDMLTRAKFKAAEMFVRDLAKQGYEYLDKHGFHMTGPFAPLVITELPSRHWQTPSRDLLPQIRSGNLPRFDNDNGPALRVPLLSECESWDFDLAGVFVHQTLVIEYPEPAEEQKEMRKA